MTTHVDLVEVASFFDAFIGAGATLVLVVVVVGITFLRFALIAN